MDPKPSPPVLTNTSHCSEYSIIPMTESHLEDLADAYGRGFAVEAGMKFYAPNDATRVAIGMWMWPRLLWLAMQNGYTCWTVFHNPSGKAVGGITECVPGDVITTPFWTKVRAGIFLLPYWFGTTGARRLLYAASEEDRLKLKHCFKDGKQIATMCQRVCISPDHQNKGLAHMMFAHVFARADQRNTPCFLGTQDPKNVRFYQKLGFEIVDEIILEPENPQSVHTWAMMRPVGGKK